MGIFLRKKGYTVFILGSESEQKLCQLLADKLSDSIILIKPLRELIALLFCIDIALTNDSGPAHLLAAFGIKTITVFCGNTQSERCGPIGHNVIIVKRNDATAENVINIMKLLISRN